MSTRSTQAGFTLIELLIVMMIIGVLASIAIPTFLGQRSNGYRTQLREDLRNAASALESASVKTAGDYTLGAALAGGETLWTARTNPLAALIDFAGSPEDTVQITRVSRDSYCLSATNQSLGLTEVWEHTKGVGYPQLGTCP
ncbi:MAG: type II secretion system protein [Actinomycetes bacterium]